MNTRVSSSARWLLEHGTMMRTRRSRAKERGVTLIEMLIVIAIMALVSAGVAVAAIKYWQRAQQKTAATNAATIREGVKTWFLEHDAGTCPTHAELVAEGLLDEGSQPTDPWGVPFRIECSEDHVSVSSDGPDKKRGTPDDIRVPPKTGANGSLASAP